MTNILFIGNCFVYHSLYFLQNIMDDMDVSDLFVEAVYVSGAAIPFFARAFDDPLNVKNEKRRYLAKSSPSPYVLYKLGGESSRMSIEKMPDTTIRKEIASRKWDEIVICDYVKYAMTDPRREGEMYDSARDLKKKISEVYDGPITYFDCIIPTTPSAERGMIEFDRKLSREAAENAMRVMDEMARRLGAERRIPMADFMSRLRDEFPEYGKYGLMSDGRHPDLALGRWAMSYFLYEIEFRKYLKVDPPYVQITERQMSKATFLNADGSRPIPVNRMIYNRVINLVNKFIEELR